MTKQVVVTSWLFEITNGDRRTVQKWSSVTQSTRERILWWCVNSKQSGSQGGSIIYRR